MADITYSINVNIAAGGLAQNLIATGITSDFATAGLLAVTLDLDTSTQAVSTSSASVLGLCYARSLNTVTAHTVSFGRLEGTTLYETVQLKGGEAALLRLAPGNYGAKSSAAGGRLVLQILED